MPKRDVAYMTGRRDAILDAAMSCLARTGSEGFSTTALCAEAGISMGALYTHFSNKDDVVVALAQRLHDPVRNRYKAVTGRELRKKLLETVDAIESAEGLAMSKVEFAILSIAASSPAVAKEVSRLNLHNNLLFTIETLQALGEIRRGLDPEVVATAIRSCIGGFMVARQMGQTDFSVHRRAMDLLLAGIFTKGRPG